MVPESIWFVEKADDGEEHGPHVLRGVPPLAGQLAALRVIHGRMQDGYTQVSVLNKINTFINNFFNAHIKYFFNSLPK